MDDKEAEKRAFAEIDWHDYAIVQTIEFTVADMNAELPAPMTRSEVESMTLAQKKMAAMIMEDAEEDIAAHQARQAATDAQNEVQRLSSSISESRDEDDIVARRRREDEERERELQRARAVQASSLDASGPIKIRTDYVPKRMCSVNLSTASLTIFQWVSNRTKL
jgi:splicing factor 3A subunit 1